MSKKSKKKPNPVYQRGVDEGTEQGIAKATYFFLEKFKEFEETEGVGDKTMLKLIDTVGRDYFTEWLEKRGIDADE